VKCTICTGEYVDPAPPVDGCPLQEMPMNPEVLFDANSTSEYSPTFSVAPGEAVLIDACDLCGGTIQVERVMVTIPNLPVDPGGNCCPTPAVPTPQIQCSSQPCGWTIQACSPPMSILTPGIYRLHLTPASVGCALVKFSRQKLPAYQPPVGLVFGGA
jgi:hypothetical protein